ncbi:hypothetical protein [Runella slithyformis]|uniref:hypothetical protein n=1 Tax=Runella slithyformis TaxID=106 RepID=UPI00146DB1F5|nr:hypothetical protein [Runella slithyformis]
MKKTMKILAVSTFIISCLGGALFFTAGEAWASGQNCKLDSSGKEWKCPKSTLGNCACL